MTTAGSSLNLILFTADQSLQQKFERNLKRWTVPATLTVTRDFSSLQRALARRTFDGLLLETRRGTSLDFTRVQQAVDLSQTFILAGSRETLMQTARIMLSRGNPGAQEGGTERADKALESYLESKLGQFVKEMKLGSARDLHPMLMRTVERPLISHALKVTNGNQIKAAHLLGMNRNTLRKKIVDLRIPINRERVQRVRTGN